MGFRAVSWLGGLRGNGGHYASAAEGHVRGVGLGVRGGGCDEGDGKGDGRGWI